MASRGSVINAALHHIGESESQAPTTDTATWVKRIRDRYDERAIALLSSHSWNFAREVMALTASEPEPEGWGYGFDIPATCLKILHVGNTTDPDSQNVAYEERAGRICADTDVAYLTFISSTWKDREGSWPQVFADALASDLAWKVSPVTALSLEYRRELERTAKREAQMARNHDAQQMPNRKLFYSQWDANRRAGRPRDDG